MRLLEVLKREIPQNNAPISLKGHEGFSERTFETQKLQRCAERKAGPAFHITTCPKGSANSAQLKIGFSRRLTVRRQLAREATGEAGCFGWGLRPRPRAPFKKQSFISLEWMAPKKVPKLYVLTTKMVQTQKAEGA